MKIQVTQEHIDQGFPGCNKACALNLAVSEALQIPQCRVSVTPIYIRIFELGDDEDSLEEDVVIDIDEETSEWIDKFDKDKELVRPVDFELDIPSQFLKPNMEIVSNEQQA